MPQKQRILVALAALFLLFSAAAWADSVPEGVECLPAQPSDHSAEGDEVSAKGPTVPRNMVLLEIVTGTW
ncbi:MAG: hypothetical protein WBC42_13310 [Candidatus Zixiibacteriota bacterium]